MKIMELNLLMEDIVFFNLKDSGCQKMPFQIDTTDIDTLISLLSK